MEADGGLAGMWETMFIFIIVTLIEILFLCFGIEIKCSHIGLQVIIGVYITNINNITIFAYYYVFYVNRAYTVKTKVLK